MAGYSFSIDLLQEGGNDVLWDGGSTNVNLSSGFPVYHVSMKRFTLYCFPITQTAWGIFDPLPEDYNGWEASKTTIIEYFNEPICRFDTVVGVRL